MCPYKSNPFAITDLLGGQIDTMFADTATAMPQVNAGKLRGLATSGLERLTSTPNLPTMDEAGVKGFDVSTWTGIYSYCVTFVFDFLFACAPSVVGQTLSDRGGDIPAQS